MAAKSQKIIEIRMPIEIAMPKIEQALKNINCNVSQIDHKNGMIIAKRGVSFKSWGETIKVLVKSVPNICTIHIISESSVSTTLLDWGKNASNIEAFEKEWKRLTS